MGSCVSMRKNPDAAMRFPSVRIGSSKGRKFFAAPSPPTQQTAVSQNGVNPVNGKLVNAGVGFHSPNYGSKEESFFDSRAYLDSDCEDDYFSVNGECTPSHGSTPNFQTSIPGTPQLNKALITDTFPDTKSEPSPRKHLGQFLLEALPSEEVGSGQNANGKIELNGKADQPQKSLDATPHLSGANSVYSSERTPDGVLKQGKRKTGKAMNCCLPSMAHSFSFNGRKKKKLPLERQSSG